MTQTTLLRSILGRVPSLVALVALGALVAAPAAHAQSATGSADFDRLVAVGDSLFAGFTDGGLIQSSQTLSVPNLISRSATGEELEQPLVSAPGIPPILGLFNLSPVTVRPVSQNFGQPLNLNLARPYDNLAVPGYTLVDATTDRSRDPSDLDALILRFPNTMLEQAVSLSPTFTLVWLGNNDVLGAATSGRAIDGVTLTPTAVFEAEFARLVGGLAQTGTDFAFLTVPDVTSLPFVTTVPPVLINPATNQPVIVNGQPVSLLGPGDVPLPAGSRVLLPATSALAQGIGIPRQLGGTGQGLPDNLVLTPSEIQIIQDRTNFINNVIRAAAAETGGALLELGPLLVEANTTGIVRGGIAFTADYITGGIFSLDGVHPTPLGYALIANELIGEINATYDADLEQVNLFPYLFGSANNPLSFVENVAEVVFSERAAAQLNGLFADGPSARPVDDGGEPDPGRGRVQSVTGLAAAGAGNGN